MNAAARQLGKPIRHMHPSALPFDESLAALDYITGHISRIDSPDHFMDNPKASQPENLFDPAHQLLTGFTNPAQVAVRPLIEPSLVIHVEQRGEFGHPPRRPLEVVRHVRRIALQFLQTVLQTLAPLLRGLVEARVQDGNGRLDGELLRETDFPVREDPLLSRGRERQDSEGSFRTNQRDGQDALAPQAVPYLRHQFGARFQIIHDLGNPRCQGLE